ncbi:zinc finger, CCHC-type, retrotransposon gag domain protein [Tanacetum coccineum]
MEGKGSGVSKQTPANNQDAPVTKGELEEARKAAEEAEKKKKANEDAERKRKAMDDKKVVEEQERKRKAAQDRKNEEDTDRLRNEEAKRRKNAEAQSDGSRGDDVASVMTWEEFEDLVMENYCPQGLMDKLEEEFLKLQQNDMTVPKYMAKFNEKERFEKYQENNRQLEEGEDNKRKRENRDDDVKISKPVVVKWRILGSINRVPFVRKHTRGNVGMTIVEIVGSQATRLRNVKLSGFVSNTRVGDIRLLTVLKGSPMILNHGRQWEEFFN